MRANLMLDEMSMEALHNLPQRMSASKIVRVLLVAATTNMKEWKQYLREHEEAREVKLYLREKFLGKFE
jgi:hypothetical protein